LRKLGRRIVLVWLTLLMLSISAGPALWFGTAGAASDPAGSVSDTAGRVVYVVPIEQTIETGLESFLQRVFREAEQVRPEHIVLIIDTLGGRVDSALNIGKLIRESPVPVTAYIRGKAASAGSYIALNAKRIAMAPGSAIGAAAVVDVLGNRVTDSKTIAFWVSEMVAAAELNGRKPQIAAGMVDDRLVVEMPEIGRTSEEGNLISLSAKEALLVGYSDFEADSLDAVLAWIGADPGNAVWIEPSFAERLAGWLTQFWVRTLLLLIGIAGVAIELFVPGLTLPGILGVAAFVLYFFGHYVAGFAGVEEIVFFLLGIGLLILEIFVPSFGILGLIGFISIVGGVVLAAFDAQNAALSLGVAFVVALFVVWIVAKIFKRRGIWNRFILSDRLTTEEGYIPAQTRNDLLGREGVSLTQLRPAGVVEIDGERVDVVTDGEFVEKGRPVIVSKVEGTRIVVRENRSG